MTEEYKGRHQQKEHQRSVSSSFKKRGRLSQLFLKQLLVSILCCLLGWGMQNIPHASLNRYAEAFGRALRYETDFTTLKEYGEKLLRRTEARLSTPVQESPLPTWQDAAVTEH